jgi:hypothetical protein
VVGCTSPAIRERAIAPHGVERPDVEVLDTVLLVHIVQGGTLAECPAQKPASVAPRAFRIARK